MEPTPQDISAVEAMISGQPAPAPAPAPQPVQQPQPTQPTEPTPQPQQQPTQPTPQPAPTQQPTDPFQDLFSAPQPQQPTAPQQPVAVEPAAPVQQPQPTQPTEPTPQPQQPVEPQPAPQAPTQPQPEQYQTFEQYMDSVTSGVPKVPDLPDASKVDPNDEASIKGFFDEIVNTAVARAEASVQKANAVQTAERTLWDQAFTKYGSLRDNKGLRDMVHAIRMSEFQKGVAITPTQAADKLVGALKQQYKQGIADNQVQTTIESVQPTGGGGQQVPTTIDSQSALTSVQTGGETALASVLDTYIKNGTL